MATCRDQIEHLEHWWKDEEKPWKDYSHSRRWLKKQMNRFIRRQNKKIKNGDISYVESRRKPYLGWEY